jgi:Holliday junction resolvase RusA-like endonuclease
MVHIIIPDEKVESLNSLLNNKAWVVQRLKNKVHTSLRSKQVSKGIAPIKKYPVFITFIFTIPTKRKRDVDNIIVKYYLDYLVREGILEEDNFFLIPAITKVCRYEKGVNKVEILIQNEQEFARESSKAIVAIVQGKQSTISK